MAANPAQGMQGFANPSAPTNQNLAPVYLNDARVVLQGDPKPKVARIVTAGGKTPTNCEVVRLANQTDAKGTPLGLEDIIDRTRTNAPVYLKAVEKGGFGGS